MSKFPLISLAVIVMTAVQNGQQVIMPTYFYGDINCALSGVATFSLVFNCTSETPKGPSNKCIVHINHREDNNYMRLTKNPSDMKEFAIAGQPCLIVLVPDEVDLRVKFQVLNIDTPEYLWEIDPIVNKPYEVSIKVYSHH